MRLMDEVFADAPDGHAYLAEIIGYKLVGNQGRWTVQFIEGPFDGETAEMASHEED
jgi:hypothetical protein